MHCCSYFLAGVARGASLDGLLRKTWTSAPSLLVGLPSFILSTGSAVHCQAELVTKLVRFACSRSSDTLDGGSGPRLR